MTQKYSLEKSACYLYLIGIQSLIMSADFSKINFQVKRCIGFLSILLSYMKTITPLSLAMLIACVVTLSCSKDDAPIVALSPVPTDGLVVWMPFNGNVEDESGNGLHGSPYMITPTTDRFGSANSAYSFDQSYIVIPHDPLLNFEDYSFSLWVATTNTQVQQALKANDYQDATEERFGNAFNYPNVNDVSVYAKYNSTCGIGNGWQTAVTSLNILDGNYHHIAGTVSGSKINMYIDGVLVTSHETGFSSNSKCFNGDIQIGREWSGDPHYFIGKIDDIAIYSRALTANEIVKIYNNSGF